MNNKLIIIAAGIFILASFVFLSVIEKKQADINTKNVWMVYFEDPKNNSLNFTVENHSTETNFHWQIAYDKALTNQGDISLKLGESKTIPVSTSDLAKNKITITVTSANKTKEIYKNLP